MRKDRGKRGMKRWELCLLLMTAVLLLSLATGARQQTELSQQVLRLHILANSDSPRDQALKLKVRDGLLDRVEELTAGIASREEAEAKLSGHLPELEAAAEALLAREGCWQPVRAEVTECWFPTRVYEDFSLPAGWYQALRVELGEGKGKNWWCVVYPPLCTAGVEEIAQTSLDLSEEQVSLITRETEEYVLRFRCAELWGQLQNWLHGE